MQVWRTSRRDRLALLAALGVPLLFTAILVPFRTSFPNTDAALALMLAVVGVAPSGYRLAGVLPAVSRAGWLSFFLSPPRRQVSLTPPADIRPTALILV